jgi:hypothetical protein
MIAGTVGEGVAVEFKSFAKVHGNLPNIDDLLNGKKVEIPTDKPDIVCALSSALVSRASNCTDEQLKNMIEFITGDSMSKEFSVLTMKDLLRLKEVQEKVLMLPSWIKWAQKHKSFIF